MSKKTRFDAQTAAAAAQTSDDSLDFNLSQGGPVSVDLGTGYDDVHVSSDGSVPQVRLTFTSSEVGNSNASDSGVLVNQDAGLAVRLQAEDGADGLAGPVSRFDDEGISFYANGNFTFDVRDLVSGTARGDGFKVVRLGTSGADRYDDTASTLATYINGGAGDDRINAGAGNDFLVGGAGNDHLSGGMGDDSFIGGGGNDFLNGGVGNDTAIYNISTDGQDRIDLGGGNDVVSIAAGAGVSQVRLTFTSAEVGNDIANDGGVLTNQDGNPAVRVQAENGNDLPVGNFTRTDDEGIRFVANGAFTFDVRDLVSGTQRGDAFTVVQLGTSGDDTYDERAATSALYVNSGNGNDKVTGGDGNDFLVGGGGDDFLVGRGGDDSFIGGTGNDRVAGGSGNDTFNVDTITGGADSVVLGDGADIVNAIGTAGGQIRITFTSAEVGDASNNDSNTLANQDGGLAVRLQGEAADGSLSGDVGRYDDEGITFVAQNGATFDVRDLVSGNARGDQFHTVSLGTADFDVIDLSAETLSAYANGGLLSDRITGGSGDDFLVGGGGYDYLNGGAGNDSLLGGTAIDIFIFSDTPGDDTILDFTTGKDKIDLSSFGITADDVSFSAAGGGTLVSVDSNSDGTADFTITLNGVTDNPPATDFIF